MNKAKNYELNKNVLPKYWWEYWKDNWPEGSLPEIRVYRSEMCLVLFINLEGTSGEIEKIKSILRDQALSLNDWSKFRGYFLPMFCVIKTSNAAWGKISTDQEWLRGTLSFQVINTDNNDSGKETEDPVEQRILFLLKDHFQGILNIKPLNDATIGEKLEQKAKESNDSETENLLKKIARSLKEKSTINGTLESLRKRIFDEYEQIWRGENGE